MGASVGTEKESEGVVDEYERDQLSPKSGCEGRDLEGHLSVAGGEEGVELSGHETAFNSVVTDEQTPVPGEPEEDGVGVLFVKKKRKCCGLWPPTFCCTMRLVILVVLATCILLFFTVLPAQQIIEDTMDFIDGLGWVGYLLFIVLFVPYMVLGGFPAWLWLSSGFVFGFWAGFFPSVVGTALGQIAAFTVGRTIGRSCVRTAFETNKYVYLLSLLMKENALLIACVVRCTVIPSSVKNYGLSVTRISWCKFAFGSTFGIIPGIAAYVLVGTTLKSVSEVFKNRSGANILEESWVLVTFAFIALFLTVSVVLLSCCVGAAVLKNARHAIATGTEYRDPAFLRCLTYPERRLKQALAKWYEPHHTRLMGHEPSADACEPNEDGGSQHNAVEGEEETESGRGAAFTPGQRRYRKLVALVRYCKTHIW